MARIAALNDGWVNFEAAVTSKDHTGFTSFSRRWDGKSWVARADEGTPVPTVRAEPVTASATTAKAAAGYPHATCVWWGPIAGGSTSVVIGELHVGTDVRGTFTYGARADSDIEVGYKYGSAGYAPSGTVHAGTSRGAAVAWENQGPNWRYQLRSDFYFLKYEYIHDTSCGPNGRYDYKVVADRWNGGATTGAKKTGSYCTTTRFRTGYGAGTRLDRTSSRAVKFTAALSAFGAQLGSTSGYSTNVDFTLAFQRGMSNHWICGNNDYPTRSGVVWSP